MVGPSATAAGLTAAWQRAAWDPDGARDLVIAIAADARGDTCELAEAGELLGRIAAITGADAIAERAFAAAHDAWQEAGDPGRASVSRVLAGALPVRPFANDAEALATEKAVLHRLARDSRDELLGHRGLLELRRATAPRRAPGRIEAAFTLTPAEHALLFAVIGSLLDGQLGPLRDEAAWTAWLAPSLPTGLGDAASHLIALGLVTAIPVLVPNPAVVGVALGRDRLESPPGVAVSPELSPLRPPARVRELAGALARGGFGVVHGARDSERHGAATAIAARLGLGLAAATPLGGGAIALRAAALEARLHGRLLAIDVERWADAGVDVVAEITAGELATCAPALLIATHDLALPPALRAFTLRTWVDP